MFEWHSAFQDYFKRVAQKNAQKPFKRMAKAFQDYFKRVAHANAHTRDQHEYCPFKDQN